MSLSFGNFTLGFPFDLSSLPMTGGNVSGKVSELVASHHRVLRERGVV